MQTSQEREITHPLTDGNLALASESLGFIQKSKANHHLTLAKNAIYDPHIAAFSQPKLIMTVMAMTIGLCNVMVPRRLHPVSNRPIRSLVSRPPST